MYTNVFFVRHAHSTYTPDELGRPLSKMGIEGAEIVTRRLLNHKIELVYSSPYKRAIQTVEGIADQNNIKVHVEENLKERKLSNEPVKDFSKAIQSLWDDYNFHFSGGESNYMAQQRGIAVLLSILKRHKGKNIAIGTHGNIMVLMMNYFDSSYGFDFWKALEMPDVYRLSFHEPKLVDVKRI